MPNPQKQPTVALSAYAPRDARMAIYVQKQGSAVSVSGDVLEILHQKTKVDSVRLNDVAQVNLFGNVFTSAHTIRELAHREIPLLHLSFGGSFRAITFGMPHKNLDLRRRQFRMAEDQDFCLRTAKAVVAGKIHNSRVFLRRNAAVLNETVLGRLTTFRSNTERAPTLDALLGIEGNAAREYFRVFSTMFKARRDDQPTFTLDGRNRRPPRDPVNAMLSFCYTLLMKEIVVAVMGVGFDPYLGFYHQPHYGRPALALDLMEEFRPIVADSVVVGLVNNGEVKPEDFTVSEEDGVRLSDSARRGLLAAFERRINQPVQHPLLNRTLSYRRIFEAQARHLAHVIEGNAAQYVPFATR